MTAYYNEIDPYAAQWLRNLVAAGHIAPGDVDERSIVDVQPNDLRGYTQCHFFAGIGVWSHAARLAGVADDFPLWTGSCPCQPFSAAGRRKGFDDERHLWPVWFRLIAECRPATVFGEQVASKDGLAWLDTVHADLEGAGYAVGAADLCAAGVGAPHIRQRLWFVADACQHERRQVGALPGGRGEGSGPEGVGQRPLHGCTRNVADAAGGGRQRRPGGQRDRRGSPVGVEAVDHAGDRGPTNGFWRDADWLPCRDGKARPAQSGLQPLAHGSTARVGRLRAYGNAIVAPVAAEFIGAWLDVVSECAPAEWEAAA